MIEEIKRTIKYLYDENVPMASKSVYLMSLYILPVIVVYMIVTPFFKDGAALVINEFAKPKEDENGFLREIHFENADKFNFAFDVVDT
ncbi:MAG: hypothetical protein IKS84_03935, partial [Lachnospiraceae bacterium]|nr:hypothetical protein [Lachnospiraceae bacterium]